MSAVLSVVLDRIAAAPEVVEHRRGLTHSSDLSREGLGMEPTQERWRAVVGFEGLYEVSDQGRVRGLDRVELAGSRLRRRQGRMLRLIPGSNGYLFVSLSKDGRPYDRDVHRLVAEAFLGPREPGMQVRHANDDRLDACLSNLSYGTQSDNEQDKLRRGRNVNANKTHCKWGHEFTPENTLRFPSQGAGRKCAECARNYRQNYWPNYRRKKAL